MVSFVRVFSSILFEKSGLHCSAGLKLSPLSSPISEFESFTTSGEPNIFLGVERSSGAGAGVGVVTSPGLRTFGLSLSDLFLLTSNPEVVSVDKSPGFSSISGFTSARSFC